MEESERAAKRAAANKESVSKYGSKAQGFFTKKIASLVSSYKVAKKVSRAEAKMMVPLKWQFLNDLFEFQNGMCMHCCRVLTFELGKPLTASVDRNDTDPSHWIGNVSITCMNCQYARHAFGEAAFEAFLSRVRSSAAVALPLTRDDPRYVEALARWDETVENNPNWLANITCRATDKFRLVRKGKTPPTTGRADHTWKRPFLRRLFAEQGGLDPYTGIPLLLDVPACPLKASLDRIDSDIGYDESFAEKSNLQWVAVSIQYAKHDFTDKETREWIEAIRSSGQI